MDFDDSPQEAAYRARARAWLAVNAAGHVATRPGAPAMDSKEVVVAARQWQALKADAGFASIMLDQAWGGGGGTAIERAIFAQEEADAGIAYGNIMTVAQGMAIPTILEIGDEAIKQRFIPPAVRGEHIWCQLFSEPSGGSDVAASRTRAVRADDGSGDWIINGQKVWTSGAHYSDFG